MVAARSPSWTDLPPAYLAQDMSAVEFHLIATGVSSVFTRGAPDKATANEDAVALIPWGSDGGALVLADGLGGMPSGEQASALAIRCLQDAIAQAEPGYEGGLRDAILNGIERANRLVAELGVGAATTLAVVEILGRTVRPYHVGDSMVLVTGQRGRIKLQTVSHSPVGYAVESGLLDAEEAMHHEERHIISNMIGSSDMRIELGASTELAPHDTLMLASDGLFDNMHVDEIVEDVRMGPLAQASEKLVSTCERRMRDPDGDHPCKPDDLSFILFRLQGVKNNHH